MWAHRPLLNRVSAGFSPTTKVSHFIARPKELTVRHDLEALPDPLITKYEKPKPNTKYTASVLFTEGLGWPSIKLGVTLEDFEKWCLAVGYPAKLLLPFSEERIEVIEYHIDDLTSDNVVISIAMQWFLYDGINFTLYSRQNPEEGTFHMFVCACDVFTSKTLESYLNQYLDLLVTDPLQVVAGFLQRFKTFSANSYYRMPSSLNRTEAEIGVTEDMDWLRALGIEPAGKSYDDLNAMLVTIQRHIVGFHRAFTGIKTYAETLSWLEELSLKNYPGGLDKAPRPVLHVANSFTRWIEVDTAQMYGYQKRLDILLSILYNRIVQHDARITIEVAKASKRDSTAMKTIAILTLVYLPATFVSSIFSTSIFDFQNWSSGQDVASKGWWVFLLTAGILTMLTAGIWFWWTRNDQARWESETGMAAPQGQTKKERAEAKAEAKEKDRRFRDMLKPRRNLTL
jgi:hypothetical protein